MLPSFPTPDAALFLDVDGTLLDIAARPDGVVVPASLRHALEGLERRLGGAVALVSGRAIADLDGLFAPLHLRASGVHGAELRFDPTSDVRIAAEHLLPEALTRSIRRLAAAYPGTLVEDKRFSVAVHYRADPAAGPLLCAAIEALLSEPLGEGCRLLPGHMVFEVKRAGFDKGSAVDAFLERAPFTGRRPIFIGDDVTDLPGFDRAQAAGGFAYSVTTPRPQASGHFPDAGAVRRWLSEAAAA